MTGRTPMSSRYSRRAFLGGIVGLTGLLAACGGSKPSGGFGTTVATSASGTMAGSAGDARYVNERMLADAGILDRSTSGISIVALAPQQDYEKDHIADAVRIDWPDIDLRDTSTDAAVQAWQRQTEQKLSVRPDKAVMGVGRNVLKIFRIGRIGQFVQVDDIIFVWVILMIMADEI